MLWLCTGCAAPKVVATAIQTTPSTPAVDESLPLVTTYILKIKRLQKGSYETKIELAQKVAAQGQVKRVHLWQNCRRCMEVKLVDDARNILEEQRLIDPLFEEIEYMDERGEYKRIQVEPEEKIISIRTNVRSGVELLQFRFSEDTTGKWVTVTL